MYNLKKSSYISLTQPFYGYIIYYTTLRMQSTVVGSSNYIKLLPFIFEKHWLKNPWAIKQKTFHRAQLVVLLNIWTLSTFTMATTASQFLYSKKRKVREWPPLDYLNKEPAKKGHIKSGLCRFLDTTEKQGKHIRNITQVHYLNSSTTCLTYNAKKDLHILYVKFIAMMFVSVPMSIFL